MLTPLPPRMFALTFTDLPPRGTGQPSTSNVLSAVVQELAQKVESFGEAMAKAAHAGAGKTT